MTPPTHALPSWRATETRRALLDFVARVASPGGADFVPPEERVAVFDNDGTLWCEKPMPIQAAFLLREVGAMAEADPSLRDRQPWKAVVTKDHAWLEGVITKHYQGDDRDLRVMADGLMRAYEGMEVEAFQTAAERYLRQEQHPELARPYTAVHLRADGGAPPPPGSAGFNYIASGGGRDFMRPLTQELYGIPPERVVGSAIALAYREAPPDARAEGGADLFDDGPAKPVRVWSRIGRRPIFAAGNSNGDLPMLRFAEHPTRPRCASSSSTTTEAESTRTTRAPRTSSRRRARGAGSSSASRATGPTSSHQERGEQVAEQREDDVRERERHRVGDGGHRARRRLLRGAHPRAVAPRAGHRPHEQGAVHPEAVEADEPRDDGRDEAHDHRADQDGHDGALVDRPHHARSCVEPEDGDEHVQPEVLQELARGSGNGPRARGSASGAC